MSITTTEFSEAQPIDQDRVGAALRAATSTIMALRTTNHRAARRLSRSFDEIAQQHTSGTLNDSDTIHALARLAADAGRSESS